MGDSSSKYSVFPVKAPPLYTPLNLLPTANPTPDITKGFDFKVGFDFLVAPFDLVKQKSSGFSEGSVYGSISRQDGKARYGIFGNATNSYLFPTDVYHASIEPTEREQLARSQTLFGLGFSKLTNDSPLSKTRKLNEEAIVVLKDLAELYSYFHAVKIYKDVISLIGDPLKETKEKFIENCTQSAKDASKEQRVRELLSLINLGQSDGPETRLHRQYYYGNYAGLYDDLSTVGNLLGLFEPAKLPPYENVMRKLANGMGLSDGGSIGDVAARINAHLAYYYQQDPSFKEHTGWVTAPTTKSFDMLYTIAPSLGECVSAGDISKCRTIDEVKSLLAETVRFFRASLYLAEKSEMTRENQWGAYFKVGESSILQQFSAAPTPFSNNFGLGGYFSRGIGSALLLVNAEAYGTKSNTPYDSSAYNSTSMTYGLLGAEMEIPLGNGKIVPSAAINYKLDDGTAGDYSMEYYGIKETGAPMWLTGGLKYNFNVPGLAIFGPEVTNAFSLEAMLSSSFFADSNEYAEGNEARGSFGANGFLGLSEKTSITASGGVVFVSPLGDNRKWRNDSAKFDKAGNEVHTIREYTGSRFGGLGIPIRFALEHMFYDKYNYQLRFGGIAGFNYTPDRNGSELFLGIGLSGDAGASNSDGSAVWPHDEIRPRPVGGEWK